MKAHEYSVIARPAIPDLSPELRYVLTEREYARREGAKLKGRWWPFFSYPPMGIFRRKDWQRYEHALNTYEHKVNKHIEEMGDGLVPCSMVVHHEGPGTDRRILVKLRVEQGSFHIKKQAPKRPKRIDGAPDKSEKTSFGGYQGFVRRGIKMTAHHLQAEFSQLGPKDSALLVNQVIYLDLSHQTKLHYEIHSQTLPDGIHGEVEL